MQKVNLRFIYIFILFQGIISFNNGLLNASQFNLLNFNYSLSKIAKEFDINNQAPFKNYINTKKDVLYSQNNDYESIESKLAASFLPSEIKERKIIKIKFDELLDLIINNNSEYKAAFQRVEQSKNRLLATISQKSPTIDLNSNGLPEYLFIDHYTNPKIHS